MSLTLIKALETQFHAYVAVHDLVRKSGLFPALEESLTEALADLKPKMDAKYDAVIQKLYAADLQAADRALLEFLSAWKSKGPPN